MLETPTLCPGCRYDLSTIPGDSGTCPECGEPFNKPAIQSSRQSLLSIALAMIGLGGLATIFLRTFGTTYFLLPRANDGSSGGGDGAANDLQLVPLIITATGMGMLAGASPGHSALARRPGVWFSALLGLLALHSAYAQSSSYFMYSWWLQPHSWSEVSAWGVPIVWCAALICTIRHLSHRASKSGPHAATRFARPLIVLAVAAAAAAIARNGHELYTNWLGRTGGFTYTAGGSGTMVYYQSDTLHGALAYIQSMLSDAAWLGTSLIAFVMWRVSASRAA
jgi:hypothetical protein